MRRHRVVLLGDMAVGKTCLFNAFDYKPLGTPTQPTIGSEVALLPAGDEAYMELWDTAGQERFRSIIASYTRHAKAALIVFDVNRRDTFASVPMWNEFLRNNCAYEPLVILVGNKTDVDDDAAIGEREALTMQHKIKASSMKFVSARSGAGVSELRSTALSLTLAHAAALDATETTPLVPRVGGIATISIHSTTVHRTGCC